MLNFISTDERKEVVKEIKEEATAVAESIAAETDTSSNSTDGEPSNQVVVEWLKKVNIN